MPNSLNSERDITWLSFNDRVLQEAKDVRNSLYDRIRFLGIFSNNLDEFFRVRVATLSRMAGLHHKKANFHLEKNPASILNTINDKVAIQQKSFDETFK
jgi:polyphosphate kinase